MGAEGSKQQGDNGIIVLVDLDRTLGDMEKHFLEVFQKKYPEEPFVPLEERNTYYIEDQYEKLPGADRNIKVRKHVNILGALYVRYVCDANEDMRI